MKREFEAFVQAPMRSSFLAAFQALLARSERRLLSEDCFSLLTLLEAEQHDALTQTMEELPPLAALSPAIHWIAAEAAQARGDQCDYELERFLLTTCLTGILETGDGTAKAPYLVPCAMDEWHACAALGLDPRCQALANRSGRAVDFVECADGTTVCFDVSGQIVLPAAQPLSRGTKQHAARVRHKTNHYASGRPTHLTRTQR